MKEINKLEDIKHKYGNIIDLPHHISVKYKQMSIENRAAQFAPFAALTGYDDEIKECARRTYKKRYLQDNQIDTINTKLQIISNNINNSPKIKIKYFINDTQKKGGSYKIEEKSVKKIDEIFKKIIFTDNSYILIANIIDINIINP